MLSNSLMNIGICDKETSTYTSFLEYILAFLIIINCNTIYSQYISGVTLFGLNIFRFNTFNIFIRNVKS